jgi:hypothetical protein
MKTLKEAIAAWVACQRANKYTYEGEDFCDEADIALEEALVRAGLIVAGQGLEFSLCDDGESVCIWNDVQCCSLVVFADGSNSGWFE